MGQHEAVSNGALAAQNALSIAARISRGDTFVSLLKTNILNEDIKDGIEDRLKLANVKGNFADNREYGNVLGALKFIKEN